MMPLVAVTPLPLAFSVTRPLNCVSDTVSKTADPGGAFFTLQAHMTDVIACPGHTLAYPGPVGPETGFRDVS